MWNAISLVEDLNSCRRVHFLRRYPLHHGHLQNVIALLKFELAYYDAAVKPFNHYATGNSLHEEQVLEKIKDFGGNEKN